MRRALRQALITVPWEDISELGYATLIELNVSEEPIEEGYVDMYTDIGLVHGARVGKEINKHLKQFEIGFFDIMFRRNLKEWMIKNAINSRITSVTGGLKTYLIEFIAKSLEEGLTLDEIVRRVQRHVLSRNFYRWQIERIVRTETTAAANYGALRAGDVSGVLMVKEWVSSHDGRTRRHEKGDVYDHWDMEGARANKEEPFTVKSGDIRYADDNVMFPGDPKGHPSNTINCRCTAGLIPQRDLNGDLIFT